VASRQLKAASANAPTADWKKRAERLHAALSDNELAKLAEATGVPAFAWAILAPGWATESDLRELRAGGAGWNEQFPSGAWTFAEHSGEGQVVGMTLRAVDGRKGGPAGGQRGLIVPANLHQLPDPVLLVEGASDVAACVALGLAAVGRPSNRSGAEDAANLLMGRRVLVVGERDGKENGAWPGRDGALAVAQQMAARLGEPVPWTLPPFGIKDMREWLKTKTAAGLNPADGAALKEAGAGMLSELERDAKVAKAERRNQADVLVDLAKAHYRIGRTADREPFAVPVEGSTVAIMFRGSSSGLRAALAKTYRKTMGRTPSGTALADAMTALEGMAQDMPTEPVALRVAMVENNAVVDLGDETGHVVIITSDGWRVQTASPMLFRRTALTASLPEPVAAEPKDLLELRKLLNVDDETWPMVVGWMVAAMIANIPHPILLLGGEQGTGKSSAARLLLGLVDPSPAPLRSEPREMEQWAVAASGSWAVCLDNISHIPAWLSDAFCKAVTGDGQPRRKLFTDSDIAVLSFRRCLMFTSIDPGALRGDLGDRLLLADLEPIPEQRRQTESDLEKHYDDMRPRLLGALYTATARVLAALPTVTLAKMPRMADFTKVLAALDAACPELTGGRAVELFTGQRSRIAEDVIEADALGAAVVKFVEERGFWEGTAGDLYKELTPEVKPKGWPTSARGMSGQLRRLRPALRAMRIRYTPPAKTDKARIHHIEKEGNQPPQPPEPPKPDPEAPATGVPAASALGGPVSATAQPPTNRPTFTLTADPKTPILGGSGGQGGPMHLSSNHDRDRGCV
jgi:hypothetical protein